VSYFLYFVEDPVKVQTAADAEKAGFGYLMDDNVVFHPRAANKGPGGKPGTTIAFVPKGMKGPTVGYFKDAQEWHNIGGRWYGIDKANPPSITGLTRTKQMPGHDIKLADGNLWRVPVGRAMSGVTPLPCALTWDGAEWTPGDVLPKYKELYAAAGQIRDLLFRAAGESESGIEITYQDELNTAALALGINYRVGPAEISLLGILTTENEAEVLQALVDVPGLLELKKKLDSDMSISTLGDED